MSKFIKLKDNIIKVKDIAMIEKIEDSLIFYMTASTFPIEFDSVDECIKTFTDLEVNLISEGFTDVGHTIVNKNYVSQASIRTDTLDEATYYSISIYWSSDVHIDIPNTITFDRDTHISRIYMVLDRLGGIDV